METPWDAYKGAPNPISSGIGAPQMHGVDFLLHLELVLHSFPWSASCRSEGKSVNHMRVTSGVEEARKGGRERCASSAASASVRLTSFFLLFPIISFLLTRPPSLPPSLGTSRRREMQPHFSYVGPPFDLSLRTSRAMGGGGPAGRRRCCPYAHHCVAHARAPKASERERRIPHTSTDGEEERRRRRPRSVTTSAEEMKSTAEERKEDGKMLGKRRTNNWDVTI